MGRSGWVVAAVVGALAPAGCDPGAVEEAADLATEGGAVELRSPLRPARGAPRVLILGLDGVGYEALRAALEQGLLPRLAALTGPPDEAGAMAHGHLAPPVTAVLPSITLAAWAALFTGEPPARNGIPGNEWFDRRIDAFRAAAPVSVNGNRHALAAFSEGLFGDWIRTPTLFERADVRSHVALLHAHRGADLLTVPTVADLGEMLGAFVEGVASEDEVDRETSAAVDRASAEGAIEAIRTHGVPDLQVVYFPGIDLFTHEAPGSPSQQVAYLSEVLDPAIGTLLDAYRDADALDGTWVVVVADHGHTAVIADDRHALAGDPDPAVALLDSLAWRVRPPELDVTDGDHQAVVAYQGAFAFVYLADRAGCPDAGTRCDWTRPPAPADVDEVAEAFRRAGVPGAPGRLAGALEMVLVPRRGPDGALTAVERLPVAQPVGTFLALEERLGWLLDGPEGVLAGDVVVMARSGGWVPLDDRFYFSHPYRSWHGSAHEDDSRVPLLVARSDASGEEIARTVAGALPAEPTQLDFAGLVLRLLERGGGGKP